MAGNRHVLGPESGHEKWRFLVDMLPGKTFIMMPLVNRYMAILGRFIIEMMGAPPEHIEKTLKGYIEKLKNAGLQVTKEQYAKPEKPPEVKLWSVFVELEAKFKDLAELMGFCFDAMPSSVEIIEPEQLTLGAKDLGDFLNDLQARLHQTDMTIKTLRAQQKLLDQNAVTIFHNFVRSLLKGKAQSCDELARQVGIKPTELQPFLDSLLQGNKIVREGDVYKLRSAA